MAGPEILLPHLGRIISVNTETGEIAPWLGNKNSAALVYQYIADAVEVRARRGRSSPFCNCPMARTIAKPFHIEALAPLANRFGADRVSPPPPQPWAAPRFGEGGGLPVRLLPQKVALRVILWGADEEFPAKAAILFDNKSHFHLDTAGLYMAGIDLASQLAGRAGK